MKGTMDVGRQLTSSVMSVLWFTSRKPLGWQEFEVGMYDPQSRPRAPLRREVPRISLLHHFRPFLLRRKLPFLYIVVESQEEMLASHKGCVRVYVRAHTCVVLSRCRIHSNFLLSNTNQMTHFLLPLLWWKPLCLAWMTEIAFQLVFLPPSAPFSTSSPYFPTGSCQSQFCQWFSSKHCV